MALGGSKKRRAILKDYKEGRRPVKLNRNYEYETDNAEQNKIQQRNRLGEYLSDLPIFQIIINDAEADDIVAYICQLYNKEEKIILSNDKDFYQLLNDKTTVFNPYRKMFYMEKDLFEEFKIYPCNFGLAKAICGDPSDNVKGVGKVGFKTLTKMFPMFAENKKITTEDFFAFCAANGTKYQKYVDNHDKICDNIRVVRLDTPLISFISIQKIIDYLEKPVVLNATGFRTKLLGDGINNITDGFYQPFRTIAFKNKEKENK